MLPQPQLQHYTRYQTTSSYCDTLTPLSYAILVLLYNAHYPHATMPAHRGLLRALALSLFVAVACGQVLTDGLVKDREALLALRNAITDFGQSKIATWRPTGAVSRCVRSLASRRLSGGFPRYTQGCDLGPIAPP